MNKVVWAAGVGDYVEGETRVFRIGNMKMNLSESIFHSFIAPKPNLFNQPYKSGTPQFQLLLCSALCL